MTEEKAPSTIVLGGLIERLKREPVDKVVPFGFHNPHSYRGWYDELAFEPARNVSVGSLLAAAESALGKTFTGWKGGDYLMDQYSSVWLADVGENGETLGAMFLECILAASVVEGTDQ